MTASERRATHPLDNPTRSSLRGPHSHFAEHRGNVMRYPVDVSPFVALPDEPSEQDWADAAALVGPGGLIPLAGLIGSAPAGWQIIMDIPGVQLVAEGVAGTVDDEAIRLTARDVPEMLDLVRRTDPGPFRERTIEMGTYLGLRRDGRLVAMAGERMRPPGWTEISAVCTDTAYRGQGLATRLVLALAAGIAARGDTPFLHAAATNTNAIRLYQSLGFNQRRTLTFSAARVPPNEPGETSAR